jgi:hypothetical protein
MQHNGAAFALLLETNELLRDIGWYHLVFACDTGQGTAANRCKIYLNGTQITSFSTATYPSSGLATDVNTAAVHTIGKYSTVYADMYLAEEVFIDGTQYAATDFGEFDTTGLYWTPKSSDDIKADLTFGNNGFYLDNTTNAQTDAHLPAPAVVLPTVTFDGTNDYLSYSGTPIPDGPAGTFSCWFKFDSTVSGTATYFYQSGGTYFDIRRADTNKINITAYTSGSSALLHVNSTTTWGEVSSGWHHIVISWNLVDTPVVHMYIDGVVDQITGTLIAGNINYAGSGSVQKLGSQWEGGSGWLEGQLAQFYLTNEYVDITSATNLAKFITTDGYPVDMGSDGSTPTGTAAKLFFNSAVDSWHTNDGTGGGMTEVGALTAGSAVQSVNSNNFTNNNTVVTTTHTPTNLMNLWNPLVSSGTTYTVGNKTGQTNGTEPQTIFGSLTMPGAGKWYIEVKPDTIAYFMVGLVNASGSGGELPHNQGGAVRGYNQNTEHYVYYHSNGQLFIKNGAQSVYGASYSTSDYVGIAADCDNGNLFFSKSGTWQKSATASEIAAGTGTNAATTALNNEYQVTLMNAGGTNKGTIVDEADWQGTPPTGFVALTSANIAEATTRTQSDPYEHWNNILYTGNGTAIGSGGNAITGAGFQPDFGWIKGRSGATEHVLTDIVRGVTKELSCNDTGASETVAEGLTAFGSDGFTVGSNGSYNTSSATYVAWCAKLGGAASTNEDGSIDSSVSVNQTLGMSVGTYTGNATGGATIGHGLNVTPGMVIVKNIDYGSGGWSVYHKDLNAVPEDYYIFLHTTSAAGDNASYWNDTAPTTSVFSIGSNDHVNRNTDTHMFIAFAPSEYISIGSYTGNANTNGTFVPTLNSLGVPLQPIFHLTKRSSATGSWKIIDAGRSTYNQTNAVLTPDTAAVEGTAQDDDLLSGGFKWRASDSDVNGSGTYVHLTIGTPIIDTDGRIIAGR